MADPPDTPTRFPTGFLWGVATASYQIEGATREDGRGQSIWDTFAATPGKVANGDTGDVACDHYHRWQEDLDLMQRLGIQAYRFSVAWPRVIPAGTGAVNPKGLDFYDRLVDGLLARGIAPFATLYHWDLPQPLQDAGGWPWRGIVEPFVAYADAVTRRLGDRVHAYATLNEPWCSAYLGHESGEQAPGLQDRALALQAAHHLLLAHGSALPAMRSNAPGAQHGIVLNLYPTHPASRAPWNQAAARLADGGINRWFLDPLLLACYPRDTWAAYGGAVPAVTEGDLDVIARPLDFLGVNYYTRLIMAADIGALDVKLVPAPDQAETTEMGWEVHPEGLNDLLQRLKRDYPIPALYLTENGAAYPDVLANGEIDDAARISFLERHVEALRQAIAQGIDVRGYFAWSLMDNFEWAHGYGKRFGLVYVDYPTQRRIPKRSAHWYADLIARERA